MFATRKTYLAVACLLLTAVTACSRRHESNDFLPSSPDFQKALQIALEALSVPADGASTVRIEAQISPDADADKRRVFFETSLGSWVDPDVEPTMGGGGGQANAGANTAAAGQTATRQADTQGKAVAFLKSAAEAGVAVITVSVLDGNDNAVATVSGEVTFTQLSDALELRVDPDETFADGVSAITLEAEISAGSPAAWNMIVFETTLGQLDSLDAGMDEMGGKKTTVPTDGNRIARARLTSSTPGTASVKATIVEFTEATVSQFVTFEGQNPDALQISTSASEVPADNTSQVTVTATVGAGLTVTSVSFNTSAGIFVSGTGADAKTVTAAPNASGQAIVQLKSDSTVNPAVVLTATIDSAQGPPQSATTTIAFIEPPTAELSITPAGWDFGDVIVGGTPGERTFAIGNHSETVPLQVTAVEIDPAADPDFSIPIAPVLPATVEPLGSFNVTVRFDPQDAGAKDAKLKITADMEATSVDLVGEGVDAPAAEPNIEVSPASLDFGDDVPLNSTRDRILTISNTGDADLTVTAISSNNGKFTLAPNPTPVVIAPNASQPVTVRYAPGAVAGPEDNGTLTISSSDPQGPVAVLMSGTGM